MKLIILISLFTSSSFAKDCSEIKVSYGKESVTDICYQNGSYYSRDCFVSEKCFPRIKGIKLTMKPYQNPLFSLCEQVGGEPYFARESLSKKKLRICISKENMVVDLPTLMETYKKVNQLD